MIEKPNGSGVDLNFEAMALGSTDIVGGDLTLATQIMTHANSQPPLITAFFIPIATPNADKILTPRKDRITMLDNDIKAVHVAPKLGNVIQKRNSMAWGKLNLVIDQKGNPVGCTVQIKNSTMAEGWSGVYLTTIDIEDQELAFVARHFNAQYLRPIQLPSIDSTSTLSTFFTGFSAWCETQSKSMELVLYIASKFTLRIC